MDPLPWGWAEELAAANVEATHALWRLLIIRWSKKGTRPPDPLHIPRPGAAKKKAAMSSKAEVVAFLKGGSG